MIESTPVDMIKVASKPASTHLFTVNIADHISA